MELDKICRGIGFDILRDLKCVECIQDIVDKDGNIILTKGSIRYIYQMFYQVMDSCASPLLELTKERKEPKDWWANEKYRNDVPDGHIIVRFSLKYLKKIEI